MTCVLETDLGKFEAETPELAVRLSKAAARKAAAEEKRVNAARELAHDRAMINGFAIYDSKAEGKDFPCGWNYYELGNTYGCLKVEPDEDDWMVKVTVETKWDTGTMSVYGRYHRMLGVVENGAGHAMLVFKDDPTMPDDGPVAWAVGAADGVLAFVLLHGITADMFRQSRNNKETM